MSADLRVYYNGPRDHVIRWSKDTPIFNVLWKRLLLRAQVEEAVSLGRYVPRDVWERLDGLERFDA